jgi:peptidoglycan biosynthesis protein MviN/MurJ (putative lipid II flippase)
MLIVRIVIAALAMVIMLSYMQTTIDWSSLSQWQRIFHVSQWLALAAVVFVSALLLQGVQPRHFKQTT